MHGSKPIIGLCGGIGAGKSRVASEFERLGCLVVDSDRLNHEVLQRADVAATLREWWGERAFGADGKPDRKKISEIIFAGGGSGDEQQKRKLESLVHPLIAERRRDMMERVRKDPAVKAIILNSPLLFESRLDRLCDAIVFVQAGRERRLERVRRTRAWDLDELEKRERWQKPLSYKRSHSEFVVDNEGPEEQLHPQVAEILETIAARHR